MTQRQHFTRRNAFLAATRIFNFYSFKFHVLLLIVTHFRTFFVNSVPRLYFIKKSHLHFCTSAHIIMYCRSFSFAQVSLKEKLNLILSARPFVGGAHRLKGHRSSDIWLFIFLLFCWKPQVFRKVLVLFRFSKITTQCHLFSLRTTFLFGSSFPPFQLKTCNQCHQLLMNWACIIFCHLKPLPGALCFFFW